ncbi:MAG: DUF1697 domain-containing protein [Spirochaetes bacterium]|nr:DUF1697 domain-containing protein [Spirochaetota bacterium]
MKRYIVLLRGINISGKNKITMSELKTEFAEHGFSDVVTYLNSGNIILSSVVDNEAVLSNEIVLLIKEKFNLNIPVFVVLQKYLVEILNHAPAWWGDSNKEVYDNLIFMMSPLTYDEFYDAVGNPEAEYEKVYNFSNAVFWSFIRKDYQKTNWWSKTASSNISGMITIRTANTVRKIVNM